MHQRSVPLPLRLLDCADDFVSRWLCNRHFLDLPGLLNIWTDMWSQLNVSRSRSQVARNFFVFVFAGPYPGTALCSGFMFASFTLSTLCRSVTSKKRLLLSTGHVDSIAGEGMPVWGFPSDKGSMVAHYIIDLPSELSDDQKAVIGEIF